MLESLCKSRINPLYLRLLTLIWMEKGQLDVQYDWKPVSCDCCGSFAHASSLCPSKSSNPQSNPNSSQPFAYGRRGCSNTEKSRAASSLGHRSPSHPPASKPSKPPIPSALPSTGLIALPPAKPSSTVVGSDTPNMGKNSRSKSAKKTKSQAYKSQ
ncbi:hypothetical protein M5K25_018672 [Dendrobium thyrsiflorum]|uniref:Uncharacterized protein n=1 Tax=Dendrobium thyrsiflorum TaxID=117978 RepID=A0ABD0UQK3_DENTH